MDALPLPVTVDSFTRKINGLEEAMTETSRTLSKATITGGALRIRRGGNIIIEGGGSLEITTGNLILREGIIDGNALKNQLDAQMLVIPDTDSPYTGTTDWGEVFRTVLERPAWAGKGFIIGQVGLGARYAPVTGSHPNWVGGRLSLDGEIVTYMTDENKSFMHAIESASSEIVLKLEASVDFPQDWSHFSYSLDAFIMWIR